MIARSVRWRPVILAVALGGIVSVVVLPQLTAHWISVGFEWGVFSRVGAVYRPALGWAIVLFACLPRAVVALAGGLTIGLASKRGVVVIACAFAVGMSFSMALLAPGLWAKDVFSPLATLSLPPLAAWLVYRRRRPPPGCCAKCGYDVTGNVSGTCPECGAPGETCRGSGAIH